MGDVAGGCEDLEAKLRRHGVELGTVKLSRKNSPKFELKKPGETSPLNAVFASIRKESPADDWSQLMRGCDWRSEAVTRFLASMRERPLPDTIKEQMIEDSLVQSFSRSKKNGRFWFNYCALAEPSAVGQVFPFKFNLPIIVDQGNARAIRSGRWNELINPTEDYGAPDILVRCQKVLGNGRKRLGIVELKKERSNHAEVSLLQGYAYAVAISELQKIYAENQPVLKALRTLLGYSAGQPATIPLAVYALVEQGDVDVVKHEKNLLTKAVLSECGSILVGVLGYELNKETKQMKLTSAVQWVKGGWKDIKRSATRETVSLVA